MGIFDRLKQAMAGEATVVRPPVSRTGLGSRTSPYPEFPRPSSASHDSPHGAELKPGQPSQAARRILYADASPSRIQKFREDLRVFPSDWEFVFTVEAEGVLQRIRDSRFDALIVELDLRGVDGMELVKQAYERRPETLCFVRTARGDTETHRRCDNVEVLLLPDDVGPAQVCSTLQRQFWLRELLSRGRLKQRLGQMNRLPTVPALYDQVVKELSSSSASLESVASLISRDPVMAAKILQVVNSTFFGLCREISSPSEAVLFLGGERTKALILLSHLFVRLDQIACHGFSQDGLWKHSMVTAGFARLITVRETSEGDLADLAFTAGLLHDIGRLLLAANLSTEYEELLRQHQSSDQPLVELERNHLGCSHEQLGAAILGLWGLPLPLVQAVARHHSPQEYGDCAGFTVGTAIHVASAFEHEQSSPQRPSMLDRAYLDTVGLRSRLNRWREFCGCPTRTEDEPKGIVAKAKS